MRNWKSLALLALALGAIAPASAGSLRLKEVEVVDANGFERPMPAMRLLVPADWQARGGIHWNASAPCTADATVYDWSAADATGATAVMILPAAAWQWSNLPPQYMQAAGPGCPMATIANVEGYLRGFVQTKRQGARILDFRQRPDLVANMQAYNSRTPMPMGEALTWVEAGEILIGYSYGGTGYRESIMAIAMFTLSRMSDGMGGTTEFGSGYAMPAFAMRAPDGALDFQLFNTMQRSIKADPEWQARMNKHSSKIAAIERKGAQDRFDITRRTNEEIRQIQQETWENQQASQDRQAEQFSRVIRGVEVYDDPLEGKVELPNTYDRAWRANDGTYIMSDDPNFDPYRDLGVDARALQRSEQ